ncbi:MarR family winged helix-turn-helix transcriptional regulator [Humidisolicoccus flavus]|uniref:MarR family winged helix-turn-helix transcriptional regulator n=1 Tax=Humidisolicoccus flavus TaxID=3111414 RepID=UPI0032564891
MTPVEAAQAVAREQQLRAWRSYFEATAMLTAELDRLLRKDCGFGHAEFNILLMLNEAPGGTLRMGDLAREIAFQPGRLTYQIGILEDRGWVRRERDADDGRVTNAFITDLGRSTLRKARPKHARHVDSLFLNFVDDANAATLIDLFVPLRERLLAERTCPKSKDEC